MGRAVGRLAAVLVVVQAAAAPAALAQDDAFGSLTPTVGWSFSTLDTPLSALWQVHARANLFVRTPAGFGLLEIGMETGMLHPRPGVGLRSVRVFEQRIGWTLPWQAASDLWLSGGVLLGLEKYRTRAGEGPRFFETEVWWGSVARLDWRVFDRWSVTVDGSRRTVFTEPRTYRWVAGVGLTGDVGLPDVLRDGLRDGGPADPACGPGESESPRNRHIGEMIDAAGVFSGSTLNGASWHLVARGLAPPGLSRPELILDGVEVSGGVFDVVPYGLLPVDPGAVRCLRITAHPTVGTGGISREGRIEVSAPPGQMGFSVSVTTGGANETGDPGLWVGTDTTLPNVERTGQQQFIRAAFRATSGWVEAGLGENRAWISERLQLLRVRSADALNRPRPTTQMPRWIRGRWSGGRFDASGVWMDSRTEDLLFLPEVGLETPVYSSLEGGGARVRIDAGSTGQIEMAVGATRTAITESPNRLGLSPDLSIRRWNADLKHRGRVDEWRTESGVGVEGLRLDSSSGAGADLELEWRTGLTLSQTRQRWSVTGELLVAEGVAGLGAMVSWLPRSDSSTRIQASTLPRRRINQTPLSRWDSTELPDFQLLLGEQEGRWGGAGRIWAVDVEHALEEVRGVSIEVGAFARHYQRFTLPQRQHAYDLDRNRLAVNTRWLADLNGSVAGLWLHAGFRAPGGLTGWARYEAQHAVGGDSAMSALHRTVPVHRLRARGWWDLPWGMALMGGVRGQSTARWDEYSALAATTNGELSGRVPAWFTIDAGFQKRILGGRAQLLLQFENLLGAEAQWHPVGHRLGQVLDVQIRATGKASDLWAWVP